MEIELRKTLSLTQSLTNQELASLFTLMVEQAPVGFAFFDTEFRYRFINEKLAEINGVPAEAHIGRMVLQVAPSIHDQAFAVFESVKRTSKPVIDRLLIGETPATAGKHHYWKESWYPVCGSSGELIGVAAIVEDVTNLINAERERAEYGADLRASNEKLTVSLSNPA